MTDTNAGAVARRGILSGARIAVALALAAALGALAGCGNQGGDFNSVAPVGQSGGALLLLDAEPADVDTNDVRVHAIVLDNTPADGYRAYVNPGGQGYRPATNYLAAPTQNLTTGWQVFDLVLDGFDPARANEIVARGARNGIESSAAALTAPASTPASSAKFLARRVFFSQVSPADSAETDTIPNLSWQPVPGAQSYILQIEGRGGLQYLAMVEGTTHQVRIGPGTILQDVPMRPNFLFRWSVAAVGADGRVFAVTPGTRAILTVRAEP